MTDRDADPDSDGSLVAAQPGDDGAPFFVSSVYERLAGDRKRTMVTISARPGTSVRTPPRRRPRPGPGREPGRRPRPRPAAFPAASAPPVAATPPVPHVAGHAAVKPRPVRASTRWPAALTLAALGLAVAVPFLIQAILLLGGGDDSRDSSHDAARDAAKAVRTVPAATVPTRSATTTAADPARSAAPAALLTWAATELAPGAVVVTDPDTAAALQRAGVHGSVAYAEAPRQIVGPAYVVDVPDAAGPAGAAVRTSLLARSLPVAQFAGAATVRQLVDGTLASAHAAWRDNADLRVTGGRELVANPALRLDDASRRAVERGAIDLRIETVLGDLATHDTVRVSHPEQAAAEGSVGVPIRVVVISTGSAAGTRAALLALPADYRPVRIEADTPTGVRAVWPLALPTASAVGNTRDDVPLRVTEETVR